MLHSVKKKAHTHFEAAIYNTNQGAWDIKPSFNLCDGALHVSSSKGFGKKYKCHGGQEELENTHNQLDWAFLDLIGLDYWKELPNGFSEFL